MGPSLRWRRSFSRARRALQLGRREERIAVGSALIAGVLGTGQIAVTSPPMAFVCAGLVLAPIAWLVFAGRAALPGTGYEIAEATVSLDIRDRDGFVSVMTQQEELIVTQDQMIGRRLGFFGDWNELKRRNLTVASPAGSVVPEPTHDGRVAWYTVVFPKPYKLGDRFTHAFALTLYNGVRTEERDRLDWAPQTATGPTTLRVTLPAGRAFMPGSIALGYGHPAGAWNESPIADKVIFREGGRETIAHRIESPVDGYWYRLYWKLTEAQLAPVTYLKPEAEPRGDVAAG